MGVGARSRFGREPLVFKTKCGICGRRVPEDEIHIQRGVEVCGRIGCLDEPQPDEAEED